MKWLHIQCSASKVCYNCLHRTRIVGMAFCYTLLCRIFLSMPLVALLMTLYEGQVVLWSRQTFKMSGELEHELDRPGRGGQDLLKYIPCLKSYVCEQEKRQIAYLSLESRYHCRCRHFSACWSSPSRPWSAGVLRCLGGWCPRAPRGYSPGWSGHPFELLKSTFYITKKSKKKWSVIFGKLFVKNTSAHQSIKNYTCDARLWGALVRKSFSLSGLRREAEKGRTWEKLFRGYDSAGKSTYDPIMSAIFWHTFELFLQGKHASCLHSCLINKQQAIMWGHSTNRLTQQHLFPLSSGQSG